MDDLELRIALQHRAIIVLWIQKRQVSIICHEPVTVVLPQLFTGGQDPHPPILLGRMRFKTSGCTKASEQVVDMAVTRPVEAKGGHRLLDETDRWPSLTASGIVGAFEKENDVIEEKSAGLDEQPDHEWVAFIHLEKSVEISPAGFRKARVLENVVNCNAQRLPEQALDFDRFQGRPRAPKIMRCKTLARPIDIRKFLQIRGGNPA